MASKKQIEELKVILIARQETISSNIEEMLASEEHIGTFTTTGGKSSYTYTLVAGALDNADFSIDGDDLENVSRFDYETKSSYSIRVRTTDWNGDTFEKDFTITITDLNEGCDDSLDTKVNTTTPGATLPTEMNSSTL